MSLMFFNMSDEIRFDEATQDRLDSVTEDFFVEVLREDLSKPAPAVLTAGSSGLLQAEKVGVARLIESLECNMWSNML